MDWAGDMLRTRGRLKYRLTSSSNVLTIDFPPDFRAGRFLTAWIRDKEKPAQGRGGRPRGVYPRSVAGAPLTSFTWARFSLPAKG